MVEYATITAALAMLASSLHGIVGGALPLSDRKAGPQVASIARSQHVSGAQARAAYAKASYRKPALRYLYAVSWVSSASNLSACEAAKLLGPDPTAAAAQALRASPKTLVLLGKAHITVSQAASAIGRGTTDGCA